ncbi:MAG: hypothetical protein JKY29_09015 [Gammaproteobacteria bacterium]|nr:hypothetical protein [Gammaproteobacteria bacterium]
MTDQTRIEERERERERESPWEKFKAQLHVWVLALDHDPMERIHERERSLNSEVECLNSRIKALELQMTPPT